MIEVEKSRFTSLVMSTIEGMAPEAIIFLERLTQQLFSKLDQTFLDTIRYIKRKIRIELSKKSVMAVRGYRMSIKESDINLMIYYLK